MPRLRDEVRVRQPESLFIGDLRELTTAYETNVAALFRSALLENMALRRQLLSAGLEPPTTPSEIEQAATTWSLVIPPRPVAPASQDIFSEDFPEFSLRPLGDEPHTTDWLAGAEAVISGRSVVQCFSGLGSDGDSSGGDSDERHRRNSMVGKRFMPPDTTFPDSPHGTVGSLQSDGSLRSSLQKDRHGLAWVVNSLPFEALISGCIILNCITEGLWAHDLVTGSLGPDVRAAIVVCEQLFVSMLVLEILLKLRALGWRAFKPVDEPGRANFLDMLLVLVTGILPAWLVPGLALIFHFDGSAGPFKTLSVLRTVRLARLVRVFQRVPMFREAWMLVHGLSDSSRTLLWTLIVIFLVTYVFAIFGLATIVVELKSQLAYRTDPDDIKVLTDTLQLMSGIDQMMICLVQVLVADSYHAFVRPILKYVWWSCAFWYAYVAVAVIVLMNLVTAIIVENAMETSRQNQDHMIIEKEAKRQKGIDKMRKLFKSMDTDGSGALSWEEFSMSFDDPDLGKMWKVLDIDQKDAWELFHILDNGEGEITISEFIEALQQMDGLAQAKDMFRLQKMVTSVIKILDGVNGKRASEWMFQKRSRATS